MKTKKKQTTNVKSERTAYGDSINYDSEEDDRTTSSRSYPKREKQSRTTGGRGRAKATGQVSQFKPDEDARASLDRAKRLLTNKQTVVIRD